MSFDTIFLDMGHTLAFPYPSWTDVYHRAYQAAGLTVDRDMLHETLEAVWRAVIAQDATAAWEATETADDRRKWEIENDILDRLGITENRQEVFEQVTTHFCKPASYRLFPEVHQTLQRLRDRGCTLAIVSNWDWHLPALCRDLDLTPYLDAVVASARVGRAKPHPEIFRTALSRTSAEPEHTLHVGDSYAADIVGAQQMGITGVLIDRDGDAETDGHPTVRRLDELLSLLDGT
ncbi:MAG: Phosphoglycolate phosphatase [Anaerolineales bacterium]|nr:Phosphoglycolate phosphatase [Anaerolineales bacterium]